MRIERAVTETVGLRAQIVSTRNVSKRQYDRWQIMGLIGQGDWTFQNTVNKAVFFAEKQLRHQIPIVLKTNNCVSE